MNLIIYLCFFSGKKALDVRDPPPAGRCANTVAYMADVTGFGILVFDLRRNRSWRVQNKLFYSCPAYGTFTIAGESFDLMDGVFGLALSPPRIGHGGKRLPKRFKSYLPFGQFDATNYDNYYSTDHDYTIYSHIFITFAHMLLSIDYYYRMIKSESKYIFRFSFRSRRW